MQPNELYHYGVIGMRWGVRRNRDTAISRTSSPRTRVLKAKLDIDKKRVYEGKKRKYNTKNLKKALDASQKFDKMLQDRVSSMSKGKAAAQILLFGNSGALTYNRLRTAGYKRAASAGAAMVSNLLWPVRYKLENSQNIVRKATEKKGR